MRLLQRDLTRFALYKAVFTMNDDGDGRNVYDGPPVAEFDGHIQPYSEKNSLEAYGIVPQYAYVVYTLENMGFEDTDRIFDGERWYEIKAIRRWGGHLRLMVEEVRQ